MPTNNPVPSTDPSDLLFNAGKLDEVVNGTANSFTDRLGATRRTVAGMNADFDAQLADAESDLNVYRADAAASASEALGYLQTIRATSYGAYASDPSTDPLGNPPTVGDEYFNTTANLLKRWNGTTWQASDINTANLAASSGSSLVGYDGGTVQDVLDAVTGPTGAGSVGYTPAGTGAVATTVREKLRETVSILGFGANTIPGVTDMSSALIAARTAAAGRKIYIPAGTYKFNQAITSSEDLIIEGDGPSTILDFTGTITGGSYALDANGTATQIQNLGATANVGSLTVTFASAPSLLVGDVFVIYNATDSSWSGFRTDYRAGEWCEVESIAGSVVTVKSPLYDTYAAAAVAVYKVTCPKVVLRDFEIRGTTVLGLIKSTLCIAPRVENVVGSHANNSVIYFDRCFSPVTINPQIKNIGSGGDDYGISIGNSQHSRIYGGNLYARRHAVTHGGGSGIGSVPTRDSRIIGAILRNDIASGVESADFHGNTEDSSFIDCTIYNGANLSGKDNHYDGCTITNALSGYCMYHSEVKGGRLGVKDCKFSTHTNPYAFSNRAVYDIGSANPAITVSTTENVEFFVNNCSFYGRNLSSSTVFAKMKIYGSTVKTNINIDGIAANVNACGSVLETGVNTGSASSDFIIVDHVSGFLSGTYLHNPVGSHYRDFPHRCQKQSGKMTLTATSGTSYTIPAAATTFKYPYPREPVGHSTTGGSTALGFNSNRAVWGGIYRLRNTDIWPWIESGDNTAWGTTATATVNWTVHIDEV